jgi:alpha-galactosidase
MSLWKLFSCLINLVDNCYSEASAGYPNTDYTPSVSPAARFANMSAAIAATGRPMVYSICEWGLDFPSAWAPAIGNTWRITNDIIPSFGTIARILNQAVPQTSYAGPGHWLDLDMLEVGNDVFTAAEEQTHFSMWSIVKSPLIIGGRLNDTAGSITTSSLNILLNSDVISYNQDSLGVAASFVRRFTSAGYEIWSGPLSGSRVVVAVINLNNAATSLTLNLPDIGLQKATSVKNVWNAVTSTNVLTSYTATVAAHGTMLLELSGTTVAGRYVVADAVTSGCVSNSTVLVNINSIRTTTTFSHIYGATTSNNYTCVITFPRTSTTATAITVNGVAYTLPANSLTLSVPLSLTASNANTVAVVSSITPSVLTITAPPATFYSSTSFALVGAATRTTCSTGLCAPVGSKIGYIDSSGSASLSVAAPSSAVAGSKYATVYFINNDIAMTTSWTTGTNTRNMTISVNGVTTRIEVPLSGKSSELFSVGLGWQDTGLFNVLLPGWTTGTNTVLIQNVVGGLVDYAADFVGLSVEW